MHPSTLPHQRSKLTATAAEASRSRTRTRRVSAGPSCSAARLTSRAPGPALEGVAHVVASPLQGHAPARGHLAGDERAFLTGGEGELARGLVAARGEDLTGAGDLELTRSTGSRGSILALR
jgi:hypothetical protein